MQLTTTLTLLFTSLALAAPQFGDFGRGNNNNNWPSNNNNNGWPNNNNNHNNNNHNNNGWQNDNRPDGNQEGFYQDGCGCTSNGNFDHSLGRAACDDLTSQYPNLYYDENSGGCRDSDGRGVEGNGYRRACQRQAGPNAVVDSTCGNDY
ncbi:hypothetical protein Slin15195_G117130 [Septoria linicola]|uniref:Uncharacterized protein n=1 Tax=Septoria linicola TaxID=215465 RepID=A0A9Q9EQ50_9PEZI|nr:hypothetical protein Slin15195_G117130 [Septoria linicola]